jgi:hypothetical protein
MNENSKYLLRLYVPALGMFGVVLWGVTRSTAAGTYWPVIGVLASSIFCIGLIYFVRRRVLRLYLQPNPYSIAAYYRKSIRNTSNGPAMAAYCSAFAFILYGQFESARAELAPVDWSALPPMYQGFERYALSLMALFEVRDYERSLTLAGEARDLCSVSGVFPGSALGQLHFETNIAAVRLVKGEISEELVRQVESSIPKLKNIGPALPAWALAVHYRRSGEPEKAEQYVAIVRRLVPYCKPLNDFS